MATVDFQLGDFRVVKETTFIGRLQVKLGNKKHVVEIPSPVCGGLYEPVAVALGKGESIVVYDSDNKVVIKS